MPLGTELGLAQTTLCYMETHSPHFLAHVYCGQTAGWINMPLGTQVGVGPGHIVLDGDPSPTAPLKKVCIALPNFRPLSIVAKRLPISATAEHSFIYCIRHSKLRTRL